MSAKRTAKPSGYALRVEVTVAAVILKPDRHILGDNMVDATLVFEIGTDAPTRPLADPEINDALARQLSRVLGVIQATVPQIGLPFGGQADEPMKNNSHEVGRGLGYPGVVTLMPVPEGQA